MDEIIIAVTNKIVQLLQTLDNERSHPVFNQDVSEDKIRNLQVTIEALRDIRFRLEELI